MSRARAIMLMGTGSDVGKSLVAAGLCRAFARRGLDVRPFKPQNMSNNAAVTDDGGEIGRAQALQARAARVAPSIHMNPVLLKPETTTGAQVIVQGKRQSSMTAREFFGSRARFMPAILDSFHRLAGKADLVIVEGAGSPAEVNLRDGDLANMGFAAAAGIPAILIGDIHRGGVIASIVGTCAVLPSEDRAWLRAFLINKFHGDVSLFDEGRTYIERETGLVCAGIIPHFSGVARLPAEDAVELDDLGPSSGSGVKICVIRLPRIANFDDLDPLRMEGGTVTRFVKSGEALPGDASLVIIPGSKSTIADLEALRREGWDIDLHAHVRRGGRVLGLCGGYQMLGRIIHDPLGLEGKPGSAEGLGLLDIETTLSSDKSLTLVTGTHAATGLPVKGYEIHLGRSQGPDCARPFAMIGDKPDGATSQDGRIAGTYIHGCFAGDEFRRAFLGSLSAVPSDFVYEHAVEETLDALADHLERSVALDLVLSLAERV